MEILKKIKFKWKKRIKFLHHLDENIKYFNIKKIKNLCDFHLFRFYCCKLIEIDNENKKILNNNGAGQIF